MEANKCEVERSQGYIVENHLREEDDGVLTYHVARVERGSQTADELQLHLYQFPHFLHLNDLVSLAQYL